MPLILSLILTRELGQAVVDTPSPKLVFNSRVIVLKERFNKVM